MRNAAAAAVACRSINKLLAQSLCMMTRMACRRSETAANRLPNHSWTKAFVQLLIN